MDNKYQTLLAQLQTASTDEEKSWIMMQFSLMNLSLTLQTAVWAAAIPHWFDFKYLNAILKTPLKESDYFELLSLTFVEPFDLANPEKNLYNRFNLHESTRKLLLKKLWEQDQEQYRELSRRAALYCVEQNQEDTAWRVETLYHALLADLPNAEDDFINQAEKWYRNFRYIKIEVLVNVMLNITQLFKLSGNTREFSLFYKEILRNHQIDKIKELESDKYELNTIEEGVLQQLEETPEEKNSKLLFTRALSNQRIGSEYFYEEQYTNAQSRYEKALSIFQEINLHLGQASCYWSLATLKLIQSDFENALIFYKRIIELLSEEKDFEKQTILICKIMLYTIQNNLDLMRETFDVFLEYGKISNFLESLRRIQNICEKYPDKPAFVELRKRIEIALNENKETPP
jgi:tetratricopeptide (TPR) repeat protein